MVQLSLEKLVSQRLTALANPLGPSLGDQVIGYEEQLVYLGSRVSGEAVEQKLTALGRKRSSMATMVSFQMKRGPVSMAA